MPILRYHTAELLATIGYSDLKLVSRLVEGMTKGVTGSRYEMKEVSLMLVGNQSEGVGDIIGAKLQGRRGVIFVGDCRKLAENNEWKSFLLWCMENKLICTFRM